jgi:hypothetical protein
MFMYCLFRHTVLRFWNTAFSIPNKGEWFEGTIIYCQLKKAYLPIQYMQKVAEKSCGWLGITHYDESARRNFNSI